MTNEAAVILRINIQQTSGVFYAASPDLPGMHVCSETEDGLRESVSKAVKRLFKLNRGMDVMVAPVANGMEKPQHIRGDKFVVQRLAA
jgi:hypothetical protein